MCDENAVERMGTPHVRTGLGIWVWVGWKPRTALRNVRLWRHLMISPIDVFSLAFPPGLSVPVVYNRSKPPAPEWNESTTSPGFVCSSVCCSWRRPIVRTGTSGDDDRRLLQENQRCRTGRCDELDALYWERRGHTDTYGQIIGQDTIGFVSPVWDLH